MISAQMMRVCREGKSLHTFPDHAVSARALCPNRVELSLLLVAQRGK
jgi:hypothetical protein